MNKKLMLLVAGALAALAFTALPGAASAKETALDCEKSPCAFNVTGGVSTFSAKPSGDTVSCTSVTGSGEMTNSTTSTVALKFHGCKETTTIFKFACSTPGQPSGTIITNTMVGHNVALPGTANEAGILLTDSKATFTCAGGFARTTVTGNVIGELETKCGAAASETLKVNFEVPTHGNQAITTWTGSTFNLIGATNHNDTPGVTENYETAGQAGKGTLTFPGQKVQVTCAT